MTPDDYKKLQAAFLAMRELSEADRNRRLAEFENEQPELTSQLRSLLETDSTNDQSFLEQPLVQRDPNYQLETRDLSPGSNHQAELPKQIGPYRILQKIGEGGHGVVFMAEQSTPFRRKVAIKWVKPGMDSKMILARFEAERQALAIMNHPSIANVVDADTTESGQPYFVMELVHGVPIDEFCDKNDLKLTERLGLFQQVCQAVHHAHRKGIIHRDIKPANVLVTVESGKPLAKVIDFGIAKALHMPLTEKTMFTEYGQIIGTLEYMSPEQAMMSQAGIDIRSDVYSLGVLLYLLITGETPLSKNQLLKKGIWELKNVLQDTQPETPSLRITAVSNPARWSDQQASPLTWRNRVKGDLDWITMQALAKEPEKRYDSAAAFSNDIESYLNGESIVARPPSTWYTFSKFVKRNRVAVTILGAVGASMLFSILALSWGYLQSQSNLEEISNAHRQVEEKAVELKREKNRADENAKRMAKMLERSFLESGWRSSIDGDLVSAQASLDDIPEPERGFEWKFISSVGRAMALPVLRDASAGQIRKIDIDRQRGMVGLITTGSLLEIWNCSESKLLTKIQLPKDIQSAVAFGSNTKLMLIGGSGKVLLVDRESETVLNSAPILKGGIRDIAHDPSDSTWLVTTGANYVIRLHERTLQEVQSIRLPRRISSVFISPQSSKYVVAGLGGELYAGTGGSEDYQTVKGCDDEIASLVWDEDQLRACDWSGKFVSFELAAQQEAAEKWLGPAASIHELPSKPLAIDVARNGNVYVAWRNGQVSYYEAASERLIPLRRFTESIRHLAFIESTGQLMLVLPSGRINLIGPTELERNRAMVPALSGFQDGLSIAKDNISVTGHARGTVKTWNTRTGAVVSEKKLHRADVFELAVAPSGKTIASVGADRQIVVASLPDLSVERQIKVGWGVRCVAFSPDGKRLAGAPDPSNKSDLREGTIDIWDFKSNIVTQRLAGHRNWVTHLKFIEQATKLVSLSVDGTARVWSMESGQCLRTIDLSSASLIRCAIIQQTQLVLGHDDGSISRWDLQSGDQLLSKQVSSDSINGLCFSPDKQCLIVSAQSNSDLIVLDANSLEVKCRLNAGIGNIQGMRADSARSQIQVFGESGLIRVWALASKSNDDISR